MFGKKRCAKGIIMSNIVILCFKIDGSPQIRMLNLSEDHGVSLSPCQWWVDRHEPYCWNTTKYSILTGDWAIIVQNVFQWGFWVV